jgi:Glycosyltransferase WbsX
VHAAGPGRRGHGQGSRGRRFGWLTGSLVAVSAIAIVPLTAAPGSAASAPRAHTIAATANPDPSNAPLPLLELGTPSDAHFYTLSWTEAEAAVTSNGFTMEPNHTGYLRPDPFKGSQALYRLNPNGRTAYLVTPSQSEVNSLLATGNWTLDGIIGYAAKAKQPGTVPLLRYSNSTEWRLALAPPYGQDLTQQGYTLDGSVGYAYPLSIRAGALYFSNWQRKTNPEIIQAGYKYFHRTYPDWWAGVRDYSGDDPSVPQTKYAKHWPHTDFSYLEPSIGFYDDSKTSTLEKQITQATGAGLDYFAFYWYWNGTRDQEIYDTAQHTFLKASNTDEMDFSLQVCAANYDPTLEIPVSQFGDATTTMVSDYLTKTNYLRANNGSPIVWLCDTRGLGSGDTADVSSFVSMLRGKIQTALGVQPMILVNQDLGLNPSSIGADGDYSASDYAASLTDSYQDYVSTQRSYYAAAPQVYVRGIMSRFDERPRYPWAIPQIKDVRWAPDWSFSLYTQAVDNTLADIKESTRISPVDNFVLVYAWNEWDEGGIIEPDHKWGCKFLNILQKQLSLRGPGCIADPTS